MIPKFRAWDGKKMHRVDAINFNPTGAEPYIIVPYKRDVFKTIAFSRCKIMHSTGLKDKNGVDVYVGDIVLMKSDIVNLENEKAIVKSDNYELYVEYVNDKYENDSLSSIIIPVKVIGNIYENEELLNG